MSDFGKEVAETLRDLKHDFANKPHRRLRDSQGTETGNVPIDKSVREAVNADLDQLIEKRETPPAKDQRKPFPYQFGGRCAP
jgi:hypothetical protein